ncbi:MAG: heme-binding protein [Xanthobacteraceae bacterium]|nr:heme-binding protein [Xanthobacteraceae bacterium]
MVEMDVIGIKLAQTLVTAALDKAAADYARPICVSVCDAYGFLLSFARGDDAPVRSVAISQGKAYSSARIGANTDVWLSRLAESNFQATYFCDPQLTALPGGAVIKSASGKVLGGVGISGLAPPEDQAIANAIAALAAKDSTQ